MNVLTNVERGLLTLAMFVKDNEKQSLKSLKRQFILY